MFGRQYLSLLLTAAAVSLFGDMAFADKEIAGLMKEQAASARTRRRVSAAHVSRMIEAWLNKAPNQKRHYLMPPLAEILLMCFAS